MDFPSTIYMLQYERHPNYTGVPNPVYTVKETLLFVDEAGRQLKLCEILSLHYNKEHAMRLAAEPVFAEYEASGEWTARTLHVIEPTTSEVED